MPRRPRAILGLLGAVAVVSGCGNGERVRSPDAMVRLELDEYRIRPQSIEVRAGEIQIVAHNAGRLTHNVKVESLDEDKGVEPERFGGTPTAFPGDTVRSDRFRLPPGKYRLLCTIGNHANLGQYAELTVTAG